MSIGKRVSDAISKMDDSDAEGVLFAICAALEATAVKEFGKEGRSSCKDFISQNLGLITDVAFGGRRILNIYLAFDHPRLKKNADGLYPIQEIFYHAVRCGLYHEAALPSSLQFTNENQIRCKNGALVLPTSLLYGFIVAVVVAPVNVGESAIKPSMFNMGQFRIPISRLWGRRDELLWLLAAEAEVIRLDIEARKAVPNPTLLQSSNTNDVDRTSTEAPG